MQIVSLELNELRFYCPITGKAIVSPEECNNDVDSLLGYWVNEVIDEPFIKDKNLEEKYEAFIAKKEASDADFCFYSDTLEEFLQDFQAENHVTFKITTRWVDYVGPQSSTVYIVLDMGGG